jgi:hypothetical protein
MSRSSPDPPASSDDPLIAVRTMIAVLPPAAVEELGRALHAKLNAPPTPAERRVKRLRFLARLLEQRPQYPECLPYVPRKEYDAGRARDPSVGPPSARLQEQFGSWARACHAAWGLLDDGRSWGRGQPWPRPPRHPKNYEPKEAIASVQRCAHALGHIPSSSEYHSWVINRRARMRATGGNARPYVHYASVMRLLAPDRSSGNGWRLVVTRVLTGPRTAAFQEGEDE